MRYNYSPCCHWNNLVCFQTKFPVSTGRILDEHLIHDIEELLYPLILTKIFPTLHKEVVIFLVIATDRQTFWFSYWCHHFDLKMNILDMLLLPNYYMINDQILTDLFEKYFPDQIKSISWYKWLFNIFMNISFYYQISYIWLCTIWMFPFKCQNTWYFNFE